MLNTCLLGSTLCTICCELNIFVSSISIGWNPNPQGDGIWRWGLRGVIRSWRWIPHQWVNAPLQEIPEWSLISLPHGDTAKRQPSMNQKVGPHQILNLLATWSWTAQLSELWEINFCCLQAAQSMVFCYGSLNGLKHHLMTIVLFFRLLTFHVGWHSSKEMCFSPSSWNVSYWKELGITRPVFLSHFCHLGALGMYLNLSVLQPVLGLLNSEHCDLPEGRKYSLCIFIVLDITWTNLVNIWESYL